MARPTKGAEQSGHSTYEPGTTVLVRAKGYPAWPAVVIGDEDVPESVLAAKPRKKSVFPVLFYNDFSFLWLTPYDCKPLTPDAARKAAQASRIGKQVKDAYLVAAEPPNYKEYVASATQPAAPEPEAAAEPSPEAETAGRKPRSRGRAKPAADRAATVPKPAARVSASSRKRSSEPEQGSKKKAKVEEPEADAEVSEDGNDDEYTENSTPEDSDYSEGITGDDLATNQDARLALCSQVREAAQQMLLGGGKLDAERLASLLKQVEETHEIEISVVRRSKLNRVLSLALLYAKVPSSLKDTIEKLSAQWNTPAEPIIRGIPEALAPKEETVEPEELGSRDITEEPASKDITEEPSEAGHEELKIEEPSAEAAVPVNGETETKGDSKTASVNTSIVNENKS